MQQRLRVDHSLAQVMFPLFPLLCALCVEQGTYMGLNVLVVYVKKNTLKMLSFDQAPISYVDRQFLMGF